MSAAPSFPAYLNCCVLPTTGWPERFTAGMALSLDPPLEFGCFLGVSMRKVPSELGRWECLKLPGPGDQPRPGHRTHTAARPSQLWPRAKKPRTSRRTSDRQEAHGQNPPPRSRQSAASPQCRQGNSAGGSSLRADMARTPQARHRRVRRERHSRSSSVAIRAHRTPPQDLRPLYRPW
jgi:hypothetical protein